MRPTRRPSSFVVFAFLLGSCTDPEAPRVPLSPRPSLGELVYRVVREDLRQSESCPAEYEAQLESHHEPFVTSFDHVIAYGVPDDFPELLGGTIKPFLDDDRLPRVVDALALTLGLLVDDDFDPERRTIAAMVSLAHAQTLLESGIAIQTAGALLADETLEEKLHALAVVAQEDDGVTYLLDDAVEVAAYALARDETPSTCTGLPATDVQATLLRTAGFVDDPARPLGSPFPLARPDANGNPAVLRSGSRLRGPFVDANGDGVADVDADGDPVDAAGAKVDLPMIGEDDVPGRDEYGRAIDDAGELVFDYYDPKRSALSFTVQIGADLLASGVHHELPAILDAALGAPVACADGPTCRVYPSEDHVVADLLWDVFELAEYGRMSVLLHTFSDLLTTQPQHSEGLIIAVGDIVRALDGTTLSLSDASTTRAVRGLVPLIAQVLAAPNASSTSTARLLVDLFQELGTDADELPEDLHDMVVNQFDPDAPGNREAVVQGQPRFLPNGDDNRTGLEQVIELFEYTDCGYVGPGSAFDPSTYLRGLAWTAIVAIDPSVRPGTLAEVFAHLLSHQSSATISALGNLIDYFVELAGPNALAGLLPAITGGGGHTACSIADSRDAAKLFPALKFLATSGAIDWIFPIARVFVDNGQRRLLVDIFDYIALEYRRDEDADPATSSSLRALTPALVELTTNPPGAPPFSTPLNRVLDAVDLMLPLQASDGNGNAVDVFLDTLAYATERRTIDVRPPQGGAPGTTTNSIAESLLTHVAELQSRVAAHGASDELSRLVDGITPLFTRTTGTGANRRLANPNLRLLAATYATVLADATALPTAGYLCYVHDLQTESADFLRSPEFAALVRVLAQLARSPNAAALEEWIVSLLRPTEDRATEVYGRLMQLAAGGLSSDASSEDLAQLLAWLGAGLSDEDGVGMREIVRTLDELLASDHQGALLTIARTTISPGPLPSHERPLSTFADVFSDVASVNPDDACRPSASFFDASAIEDGVVSLTEFLARDPDDGRASGIEQIWSLVGSLAPEE